MGLSPTGGLSARPGRRLSCACRGQRSDFNSLRPKVSCPSTAAEGRSPGSLEIPGRRASPKTVFFSLMFSAKLGG